MESQYDPRMDFYKKAIDFLFRQGAAVVIAVLFLGITLSAIKLMWGKIERMESAFELKLEKNDSKWSSALNIARMDWLMCEEKREQLAVKVAELTVKINRMEKRR